MKKNLDQLIIANDYLDYKKQDNYLKNIIPYWHFPMLNDQERNILYHNAIKSNVKDKIVLDLGSGSGLLSMIAASNGAKKVYAVEKDNFLSVVSRKIISQNGYEGKIEVINNIVSELSYNDIPEPIDVIVTEIFDCGLLGEGCINTISSAKKFLKDNGKIIPLKADILGNIGESEELRKKYILNEKILNFNFQDFLPYRKQGIVENLGKYKQFRMLSKSKIIKSFNFCEQFPKQFYNQISFKIIQDGTIDYLVLWFRLHLDKDKYLENEPTSALHWDQWLLFPLEPIKVKKNQIITISLDNYNEVVIATNWEIM